MALPTLPNTTIHKTIHKLYFEFITLLFVCFQTDDFQSSSFVYRETSSFLCIKRFLYDIPLCASFCFSPFSQLELLISFFSIYLSTFIVCVSLLCFKDHSSHVQNFTIPNFEKVLLKSREC